MKQRYLALLPARGGSKRIPQKNIMDFQGQPMLSYPLRAAHASGLFDLIHVSTDDGDVKRIAEELGADVSFKRPAALADDNTGILPVAKWVLEAFAEVGQNFDAVVILFPCSPLLSARDLRAAVKVFEDFDGKRNLLSVGRNPVPAEWLYRRDEHGALTPLNPGGAFIRGQDLPEAYYETGTFTVFSTAYLLSGIQLADDTNYISYELPAWKAIDIDVLSDWAKAEVAYITNKKILDAENDLRDL
jgi:pseudaminic acid cytidylyltransferase